MITDDLCERVQNRRVEDQTYVTILDSWARTVSQENDVYSEAIAGHITLVGKVTSIRIEKTPAALYPWDDQTRTEVEELQGTNTSFVAILDEMSPCKAIFMPDKPCAQIPWVSTDLVALLLWCHDCDSYCSRREKFGCIVLEPLVGRPGHFLRVGLVTGRRGKGLKPLSDSLLHGQSRTINLY